MRNGGHSSDDERENLKPNKEPEKNGWQGVPTSQQFNIHRRIYHQDQLNEDADYHEPVRTWRYHVKKFFLECGLRECLNGILPIMHWLPHYDIKEYALGDILAGSTTAVMHIPQGMAYALLADVAPVVGLYMAFFPVLVYVLFGTSPHISLGTFAVACLMSGKVVSTYATQPEVMNLTMYNTTNITVHAELGIGEYSPIQVVTALCLVVGIIQTFMWMFRCGAVSTLLSEPLVSGFTTGAAIFVLCSQLKDLFGVKVPKIQGNHKVILATLEVIKALPYANWAAVLISCVVCVVLLLNNELLKPWVAKRSRIPVPIELIAIVAGTLASKWMNLQKRYGMSLIGEIPTGFPSPAVPPLELLPTVAIDAFSITMVTYTISMSMALIFAAKEKYEVDANQELLALGASNVFGAFFSCAPICASLSRSYIQYQAGAKSMLTLVVSASLILCVLLFLGPFFEDLPRCVLASIIVVSLKGMFMQVTELKRFCCLSKLDGAVWLITFLTTTLINIDIGLVAGLLASVGALFMRSQKPYTCLLGRVLETDLYLDIKRYRAAEELPGIKVFHYCGGLNFATKNIFRQTIFRKIGYLAPMVPVVTDDHSMRRDSYVWDPTIGNRVHCVIIDASALSYVDAPGIKALLAVQTELVASNITVLLAGANGRKGSFTCLILPALPTLTTAEKTRRNKLSRPMLEMIDRYNALETTNRLQLDTFPTVHDAVVYYERIVSKRAYINEINSRDA